MKWEKVKLGDIASFSNGINFDKTAYSKGVRLIGVADFGNRITPEYDNLSEVNEDIVRPTDYLEDGDIVFVRSNGNKELVGRCMLVQNPPVNNHVFRFLYPNTTNRQGKVRSSFSYISFQEPGF